MQQHFIHLYGGIPTAIPTDAPTDYQLTTQMIRDDRMANTRAVLIGSPSHPTGPVVTPGEMNEIARTVRDPGGQPIVDEIPPGP